MNPQKLFRVFLASILALTAVGQNRQRLLALLLLVGICSVFQPRVCPRDSRGSVSISQLNCRRSFNSDEFAFQCEDRC
jgi:hypothetical protein